MATEKKYFPSTFAKYVTFQDGGEILNIDFANVSELITFLKDNSTDNRISMTVGKQKNDQTKGSVSLNTFVPKAKEEGGDGLPF